ncbi:MAG: NRDE family protein [Moraxellaceae bacterium]|nr:NRDE family protein [Moraxellaceae bacterium]MDZ4386531.1 NRDE family protein [Moraxellaceae bacterium]
MCLIVLHWQPDAEPSLQVWANRDEFRARPALPTEFWSEAPHVLAGRDVLAGGTWMGVTRQGRFAAITNFRDPVQSAGQRSRGQLVADFLTGQQAAAEYAHDVQAMAHLYTGFSMLISDAESLYFVSSRSEQPQALAPGWYGLSNALLDTPWPKLQRLKAAAQHLVASPQRAADAHLSLLKDTQLANDAELPNTGVGVGMERLLSPICIQGEAYGTRNSTWLSVGRQHIRWEEWLYDSQQRLSFRCERE